ncbi:hypothetical protein OQH60_00635 [Campylobacter sp. MIT 21-1685]|uniref:hypothetical protein n=1 Tax=unclassified Campylobacter TaxID=2593542 RepID=UPI00224B0939|nr:MULTISPECIES: hypothetical protein [unclassified Campylobacter]MCX2682308.1 hypothetical protein [Campylobacter sp. MIT 21-1684]MCX2750588.1 hypothetical protein [Campylobacter sp. MIT 21-1682]MCX2806865.1 hypothetical protein [Campylobacter sp. MIT 21-1685]
MERIICILIFFHLKLFAQDEFIFWAELSSKNFILFHQSQNLSLAMTKSEEKQREFLCELFYTQKDIHTLPRTELGLIDDEMPKTRKLEFLNAHKNELNDCFIGAKVSVKDITKTEFAKAHNETYIKILPLRFTIEFNENAVLIYQIQKK